MITVIRPGQRIVPIGGGMQVRTPRGGILPFTDNFNRGDGALAAPWLSGGATWAISGNEAVNTPTEGAELVVNGDFSAWTGDDPDNWIVVESPAATEVSEVGTGEGHGGAGTGMCNIYRSGGGSSADPIIRQAVLTAERWYKATFTIDTRVSGTVEIYGLGVTGFISTGSKLLTGRATVASLWLRTAIDPTDMTFDDVSCKQLTLNTLVSAIETDTTDVVCLAELDTIVSNTQAGVVVNLDSVAVPANFVIGYHNGTQAGLTKCVAGTYTNLISTAAAYAAGANIEVRKSGTTYQLWYNGVQRGANQTINDAGIISNTLHGIFSTYSGNQIDNVSITAN